MTLIISSPAWLACLNDTCKHHQGWRGCEEQNVTVGVTGECLSFAGKEEHDSTRD